MRLKIEKPTTLKRMEFTVDGVPFTLSLDYIFLEGNKLTVHIENTNVSYSFSPIISTASVSSDAVYQSIRDIITNNDVNRVNAAFTDILCKKLRLEIQIPVATKLHVIKLLGLITRHDNMLLVKSIVDNHKINVRLDAIEKQLAKFIKKEK